jgi:hypothetical protein
LLVISVNLPRAIELEGRTKYDGGLVEGTKNTYTSGTAIPPETVTKISSAAKEYAKVAGIKNVPAFVEETMVAYYKYYNLGSNKLVFKRDILEYLKSKKVE